MQTTTAPPILARFTTPNSLNKQDSKPDREQRRCVQGLVESRQLKDREGQAYTLCLLARRSRLHPGMRYIARGLNALASPGNEIECDQVAF